MFRASEVEFFHVSVGVLGVACTRHPYLRVSPALHVLTPNLPLSNSQARAFVEVIRAPGVHREFRPGSFISLSWRSCRESTVVLLLTLLTISSASAAQAIGVVSSPRRELTMQSSQQTSV